MPPENNQFDFSTISDFILTLQYTARDGGAVLGTAATDHLNNVLPTSGISLLSLRHQFPNEWQRFLQPEQAGGDQELIVTLGAEHFPFYTRGRQIMVSRVEVVIDGAHTGDYRMTLQLPGDTEQDVNVPRDPTLENHHHGTRDYTSPVTPLGEWRMKIRRDNVADTDFASLPADDLTDLFVLVAFRY
jgi:hypothetical protein